MIIAANLTFYKAIFNAYYYITWTGILDTGLLFRVFFVKDKFQGKTTRRKSRPLSRPCNKCRPCLGVITHTSGSSLHKSFKYLSSNHAQWTIAGAGPSTFTYERRDNMVTTEGREGVRNTVTVDVKRPMFTNGTESTDWNEILVLDTIAPHLCPTSRRYTDDAYTLQYTLYRV